MDVFRQAWRVHSCEVYTAPAGDACLNNNAPHRRGRPFLKQAET